MKRQELPEGIPEKGDLRPPAAQHDTHNIEPAHPVTDPVHGEIGQGDLPYLPLLQERSL